MFPIPGDGVHKGAAASRKVLRFEPMGATSITKDAQLEALDGSVKEAVICIVDANGHAAKVGSHPEDQRHTMFNRFFLAGHLSIYDPDLPEN